METETSREIEQKKAEQAVIHRRLLRAAQNFASPEELSEATGGVMTPAEAYLYVDNFLKSRAGTWDEVQQRQLVVYRLIDFMDSMLQDVEYGDAKARNTYLAAIRTHLDALDRHSISLSDINTKLTSDHARFFIQALLEGMKIMVSELSERGVVISEDDNKEILELAAKRGLDKLSEFTLSEGADD